MMCWDLRMWNKIMKVSEVINVEKEWRKVKLSLQNAAKELLPKKVKKKRGWMNDKIISKMAKRKNVKNKTTEYNVINKEIVDECRQAKGNWLNEQCEEIEGLGKQHKTKEMYNKVKELRNIHLKVEDLSQIKMKKNI